MSKIVTEGGAMRRIVNSTYVSLDGVIEHLEKWHFDYLDEDANALVRDQLSASDAVLIGRKSYEGHAEAWPVRTGDFADKSTRWKVRRLDHDEPGGVEQHDRYQRRPRRALTKLKRKPGKDILMWGFGPVAERLLEHGLLDQLCLWIHPVLVGIGGPGDLLFRAGTSSKLKLVGDRIFGSGVVVLTYRPEAAAGASDVAPPDEDERSGTHAG
jgi:dihydrofolate reductase